MEWKRYGIVFYKRERGVSDREEDRIMYDDESIEVDAECVSIEGIMICMTCAIRLEINICVVFRALRDDQTFNTRDRDGLQMNEGPSLIILWYYWMEPAYVPFFAGVEFCGTWGAVVIPGYSRLGPGGS